MILKEGDFFEQLFIITKEHYSHFINLSNDRNPLHINTTFAKEKGFKDVVMHGNILNAFLSYFIGECLPIENVIIHSQEIQFKNPVYMNDQLFFKSEVVGYFESVNAIEFKFSFKNEENKTVAKGKIQIGILP